MQPVDAAATDAAVEFVLLLCSMIALTLIVCIWVYDYVTNNPTLLIQSWRRLASVMTRTAAASQDEVQTDVADGADGEKTAAPVDIIDERQPPSTGRTRDDAIAILVRAGWSSTDIRAVIKGDNRVIGEAVRRLA